MSSTQSGITSMDKCVLSHLPISIHIDSGNSASKVATKLWMKIKREAPYCKESCMYKGGNCIDINSSLRTDLVSFKKKLQSPKVVVCEGSTTWRGDSLLVEHLPVNANLQSRRIWRSVMPLIYP